MNSGGRSHAEILVRRNNFHSDIREGREGTARASPREDQGISKARQLSFRESKVGRQPRCGVAYFHGEGKEREGHLLGGNTKKGGKLGMKT